MYDETIKLLKEFNEVKKICVEKIFDNETLSYVSDDDIMISAKMFNLMNSSCELLLKQAEMIDSIDNKLDEILSKIKTQK